MAATQTTTAETRVIFTLARGDERTTRSVALPGKPTTQEEITRIVSAFGKFKQRYMNARIVEGDQRAPYDYFQPTSWRDAAGSSSTVDEPWTTTNMEMEFYTVERVRYDGED